MQATAAVDVAVRATIQIEENGAAKMTVFATAEYAPGKTTTVAFDVVPAPWAGAGTGMAEYMRKAVDASKVLAAVQKSRDVAREHGEL